MSQTWGVSMASPGSASPFVRGDGAGTPLGPRRAAPTGAAASTVPNALPDPAFADLFLTQYTPMVRLATLLGADDPENVVQQAFVNVLSRWSRMVIGDAPAGYLATTVINLVRSQHRRVAIFRRHRHLLHTPTEVDDGANLRTNQAQIIAALDRLSARPREALILRFWLDYSEKQIAKAMNTSVGTVKSHVSRGLSALRAIVETGE